MKLSKRFNLSNLTVVLVLVVFVLVCVLLYKQSNTHEGFQDAESLKQDSNKLPANQKAEFKQDMMEDANREVANREVAANREAADLMEVANTGEAMEASPMMEANMMEAGPMMEANMMEAGPMMEEGMMEVANMGEANMEEANMMEGPTPKVLFENGNPNGKNSINRYYKKNNDNNKIYNLENIGSKQVKLELPKNQESKESKESEELTKIAETLVCDISKKGDCMNRVENIIDELDIVKQKYALSQNTLSDIKNRVMNSNSNPNPN
jgi:uncharacterized membrane protein